MKSLSHIIYTSKESVHFSESEIEALLCEARAFNGEHNITGMLLYDNGVFFQVLEGDEFEIRDLFEKISEDARHNSIVRIVSESIGHRSFADWTMGYASLSDDEISQVVGINDFFTQKGCLESIDAGRANRLLHAFAQGRWRLS
ncbi:MAG: BLUF domain-containing protein [Zetaproteobacteria bacterium]|nr:BLUF domain-containing protein [Zetaproteobacteria bacterium]